MKVKLWVFVDDDSEAQCLSHLANYGGNDSTFLADSLEKQDPANLFLRAAPWCPNQEQSQLNLVPSPMAFLHNLSESSTHPTRLCGPTNHHGY